MDIKLQEFNYTVGIILARLYEAFPRRISLSNKDLAGYEDYEQTVDDGGRYTNTFVNRKTGESVVVAEEDFQYYRDTLRWLENEGLIAGVPVVWGIRDATLTMQGLNFLNLDLSGSGGEEGQELSLVSKLLQAISSGAKDQVAEFIGKAIASFVFATFGKG